ncbi:hypothetical protein MNBD_CPR01-284, partial [hydrothermal vent metagenome]
MHIADKILRETSDALNSRYKVYVNDNDWKLFKQPLTDTAGNIIKSRFEKRQEKSLYIITTILDIHGKANIVKFLGQLARIEPRIQELQPWVRDHVVHAINTFIL